MKVVIFAPKSSPAKGEKQERTMMLVLGFSEMYMACMEWFCDKKRFRQSIRHTVPRDWLETPKTRVRTQRRRAGCKIRKQARIAILDRKLKKIRLSTNC
jgi:hypothetical protein